MVLYHPRMIAVFFFCCALVFPVASAAAVEQGPVHHLEAAAPIFAAIGVKSSDRNESAFKAQPSIFAWELAGPASPAFLGQTTVQYDPDDCDSGMFGPQRFSRAPPASP